MRFRLLDVIIISGLLWLLIYHPNLIRPHKQSIIPFTSSEKFSSDNTWYMWGVMPWNGWNYGTAKGYNIDW